MTLPDGPKTPKLLQQLQWIADPVDYMETTAQHYGDIFTSWMSPLIDRLVFVSNPQALQRILTNPKQFSAPGNLNRIINPWLGSNSLLVLDAQQHKMRRKLLMPPFHGERMQAYGQLICDITKQAICQWKVGQRFSMRDTIQKITLRVILQAVFGLYEGPRYVQLEERLSAILNAKSSPLSAILQAISKVSLKFVPFLKKDFASRSPGVRIKLQKQQIDELLYAEIRDRRTQGESGRSDILSLLLSARDENGLGLNDEELRDELMTLLVTGQETTSNAISWALYWIHHLPEVKDKLLKEIDSLGENSNPMSLFKLPYLTAVCQESLRIYPVSFSTFPRQVEEAVEILGKQLDRGTIILCCIHLLHQREDLYPDPKQFKPERFLERQFSPYEYMPFGGGTRRCIGAALAEFEMKLVLATILKQYQLKLADSSPVKSQYRGTTLGPSGGVKMIMTGERKND